MNKQQAMKALDRGQKVKHETMPHSTYLYRKNGQLHAVLQGKDDLVDDAIVTGNHIPEEGWSVYNAPTRKKNTSVTEIHSVGDLPVGRRIMFTGSIDGMEYPTLTFMQSAEKSVERKQSITDMNPLYAN